MQKDETLAASCVDPFVKSPRFQGACISCTSLLMNSPIHASCQTCPGSNSVKAGGADPQTNSKLSDLLKQAKVRLDAVEVDRYWPCCKHTEPSS